MPSSNSGNAIGRVIGLKGSVHAELDGDSRVLDEGSPVFEGETIITKGGANVEIRFLDDTILSQGPDAVLRLDEYVFDPNDIESSGLSFDLLKGAFRNVTGKIAEQNPERVSLESPLSLIGIRGTTTVHNIDVEGESHGAEFIASGHMMVIRDTFGETRVIALSMRMIDVFPDRPMEFLRPLTPEELQFFHSIAPISLEETGLASYDPEAAPDYPDADASTVSDFPQTQMMADTGTLDESLQLTPMQRLYTILPGLIFTDRPFTHNTMVPRETDFRNIVSSRLEDHKPASEPAPESDPDWYPDWYLDRYPDWYPDWHSDPEPAADDNPAYWETLPQDEDDPDYSWFTSRGYQILADPAGDGDGNVSVPESDTVDYAVFGFGGDDVLDVSVGSGSHYLYGGSGNDTIFTGEGSNIIYGGSGNDTIVVTAEGHAGNDMIDGWEGDANELRLEAGNVLDNVFPNDDQLKNIHVITLVENATGVNLTGQSEDFDINVNPRSTDQNTIIAGEGNDTVYAVLYSGEVSTEHNAINGGGGVNHLNLLPYWGSYSVDDSLFENVWNMDVLNLVGGDEQMDLQSWSVVYGGTYFENAGFTNIYGSGGSDRLDFSGVANTDLTIDGGAGDDVIYGGGGNDTISAGLGADTVWGEGGSNRFVYTGIDDSSPDSQDIIGDFGSDGINTLLFEIEGIDPVLWVGGDVPPRTAAGETVMGYDSQNSPDGTMVYLILDYDPAAPVDDMRIFLEGIESINPGDIDGIEWANG